MATLSNMSRSPEEKGQNKFSFWTEDGVWQTEKCGSVQDMA